MAKKLPVDDQIPAQSHPNNVSCVLYVKFRIHKHCLLKHFAFLKNVCYHLNFKFGASSNLLFFFSFCELLIGRQQTFLECIVIFL